MAPVDDPPPDGPELAPAAPVNVGPGLEGAGGGGEAGGGGGGGGGGGDGGSMSEFPHSDWREEVVGTGHMI